MVTPEGPMVALRRADVEQGSSMGNTFEFADELGPAKIIHVHEPSLGLKAILVIDNVATGPSIGGLRVAPDVSTQECFRLARAMTLKNAAANLRHGGGKSVLFGDPKMPDIEKAPLVRAFASALAGEADYIFGPDMGTDEACMAWVHDEIGRSVGLPRELGGIPLDEIGATAWGLVHAIEVAAPRVQLDLRDATVAVQGFGAVGRHTARFLAAKGTRLVAVADSGGAVVNTRGLDVEKLMQIKDQGRSVADYRDGDVANREDLVGVACDIWVPAARPDAITADNVGQVRARLVAQGANIPVTADAEACLHERGILSLPDFIANAGGVICAAVEYAGGTERVAFDTISETVGRNTATVLTRAEADGVSPREAALALAEERVRRAMSLRRWHVF